MPVEGVAGRLMAGLLVAWLNRQGAWLVSGVLAAAGTYFAMAMSFRAILDWLEDRWERMQSWHERWRNWREERAEMRAELELIEDEQKHPGPAQRIFSGAMEAAEADTGLRQPSRFAAFFGRRAKTAERNPVDEVPAFQRVVERADATAPQTPVAMTEPLGRSSIWERTPEPDKARTQPVPFPAPAAVGVRPETAIPVEARRTAAAEPRQIAHAAQPLSRQRSPSTSAPMPT